MNYALDALCDELMAMFPPFLPSHPAIDKELREGVRKRVRAWAGRWVDELYVDSYLDRWVAATAKDPEGYRRYLRSGALRSLANEVVESGQGVVSFTDHGLEGNAYRTSMGLCILRTAPKP
jgi:hypothetical protein